MFSFASKCNALIYYNWCKATNTQCTLYILLIFFIISHICTKSNTNFIIARVFISSWALISTEPSSTCYPNRLLSMKISCIVKWNVLCSEVDAPRLRINSEDYDLEGNPQPTMQQATDLQEATDMQQSTNSNN